MDLYLAWLAVANLTLSREYREYIVVVSCSVNSFPVDKPFLTDDAKGVARGWSPRSAAETRVKFELASERDLSSFDPSRTDVTDP